MKTATDPVINFDQKQRVNLSPAALDVLQMDASSFGDGATRTGFLNAVLRRCTAECDASISMASERYREELTAALSCSISRKELQSDVMQKGIRTLVLKYEENLSKKALSWPKGESFLFRLSNENCEAFYGSFRASPLYPSAACYGGRVSRYLKAILEEYASHTLYEREALYFHEELSMIRLAKESDRVIRIVSSNPARGNVSFDVRVYDVLPDDSTLYHYIVGMASPSPGSKSAEHIVSLRLSRIRSVRILNGSTARSGHLTAAEKRQIEERMEKSRVQFLASDREDIAVRFTPEGLSLYRQILYMRPRVDFIDSDGIWHFSCSSRQAEYYFEKFGADAQVLSPEGLRDRLAELYQRASEVYGPAPEHEIK